MEAASHRDLGSPCYLENNGCVLKSPPEIGATNWVLFAGFSEEKKLNQVRIYTADGECYHPSDAPPDLP